MRESAAIDMVPGRCQQIESLSGHLELLVTEDDTGHEEFPRAALDQSVAWRFERTVDRFGSRTALQTGKRSWTYAELNQAANRIAHALLAAGGPGSEPVALLFESNIDAVIALLGVLKAGGCFAPLDPSHPTDRIRLILDDAAAGFILTSERLAAGLPESGRRRVLPVESLPERGPWPNPALEISPVANAYLLYTSGSTGRPKGVVHTQQTALHNIRNYTNVLHVGWRDRVSLLHSCSYSSGVVETLYTLLNGATLCPYDVKTDGLGHMSRWLEAQAITILNWTPSLFRRLVQTFAQGKPLLRLRLLLLGSEPVTRHELELYQQHFPPNCRLVLRFGSTEANNCCLNVFDHSTRCDSAVLPSGYALEDKAVFLADEADQRAGVDRPGEILVQSRFLSPGYWRQPELTARSFLPCPGGGPERVYRTGDLGLLRSDGSLQFLGRKDFQVKTRGLRIETSEIEAALLGEGRLKDAVVVARPDSAGEPQLVAYVVAAERDPVTEHELRLRLAQRLPQWMVPAFFVFLPALPLGPTGKVDRRGLPAPTNRRQPDQSDFVPPQTSREHAIAAIWTSLLGLDRVGVHDNFFKCGGHSLLGIQVLARIEADYGVTIPLAVFLVNPTIAGLVAEMERRLAPQSAPGPQQSGPGALAPLVVAPGARAELRPLSLSQERLWFVAQLHPQSLAFNLPKVYRVTGPLDLEVLARALEQIVWRHESLRTTFPTEAGEPRQRVAPPAPFSLPVQDLSGLAVDARQAEAERQIEVSFQAPLDLTTGPLFWAKVLRLNPHTHFLLFNTHHLVSDGWSLQLFCRELSEQYRALRDGRHANPAPPVVQYSDYAIWQRHGLTTQTWDEPLAYWRRHLAGAAALVLPTDRPPPARPTHTGAEHRFLLAPDLVARLRGFCLEQEATLFMGLLAVFNALLSRYSGQDDIVVGFPMANRQRVEIEPLIGFFVNTLVLRTRLSGNPSFRDLVGRVRQVALDAFRYHDVPFEKVVQELNPVREPGRHPLVQVMFALQNTPDHALTFAGAETVLCPAPVVATHFDLEFHLSERAGNWHGQITYNRDLFDPATIVRFSSHYQALLESLLAEPERPVALAPFLSQAERHQLVTEWAGMAVEYPRDKCLHELFEAQAARTPDAVAVVCDERRLTYRELNERANQLAHYLRRLGVGPNVLVGMHQQRSLAASICLLAILKAGGAYLPLDPEAPPDRLAFILADSGVRLVLSAGGLPAELSRSEKLRVLDWSPLQTSLKALSRDNLANLATADSLAYVMFTSGSTGRPKGASIPHRGVVRLVYGQTYASFDTRLRVLALASLAFDASTFELWAPWLHGGCCVLYPDPHPDFLRLRRFIQDHQITCLFLTTGLFNQIVDTEPLLLAPVPTILTGGEEMSLPHLRRAREALSSTRIVNVYGPTESTTFACFHTIDSLPPETNCRVPIGRPLVNTSSFILDQHLQPVPIGVPGELCLGGDGLARGYLNRPELTRERFVPNPFSPGSEAQLYRTGDRCRWRNDGNIEFLGRLDRQVKIRGYRVELGEVEAALGRLPEVQAVAVEPRTGPGGTQELVAYLVPQAGQRTPTASLRHSLGQWLPDYMIPALFLWVERLPLNSNGKIDRHLLELPPEAPRECGPAPATPASSTASQLAALWATVLGRGTVGPHDNFFDLGGHSLLAMRLMWEIHQTFGRTIPLAVLFAAPTPAQMASHLEPAPVEASPSSPGGLRGAGDGPPLFHIPGVGGYEFLPEPVARRLGQSHRFYDGFQFPGLDGRQPPLNRVEALASHLVPELLRLWPHGPFWLGGYSFGGVVAFETARQLLALGRQVDLLLLWDSTLFDGPPRRRPPAEVLALWRRLSAGLGPWQRAALTWRMGVKKVRFLKRMLAQRLAAADLARDIGAEPDASAQRRFRQTRVTEACNQANGAYRPGTYRGRVVLLRTEHPEVRQNLFYTQPLHDWERWIQDGLETIMVPGDHASILKEPDVSTLADVILSCLNQACRR